MCFVRDDVRDQIGFTQKLPPTFVSALRSIATVETAKNQLSRDFGTFDFRRFQQYRPQSDERRELEDVGSRS